MCASQTLTILHISDLHIRADLNVDQSVVMTPMIKRIEHDRKKGLKPELIMVTGDIAFKGIEEER